jgi:hypothetical protein
VVKGDITPCYGPGPNLNIRPITTVRVTNTSGDVVSTFNVSTNLRHHSYEVTLMPGRYIIGIVLPGWHGIPVTVHAGKTQSGVDLPAPSCV